MSSEVYVRVTDRAGNEFLCQLSKLRDPKNMSEEDLENCVDEAVVQRYAGDIEIQE
jgi:hypothetical protein